MDSGNSTSAADKLLGVTLLADEWGSSKGGLSTINRELAKQLAKHPNVKVTFFVPKCSDDDKRAAVNLGITVVEAEEQPGYDPVDWLAFPPKDLSIDVVVGHGVKLGRQARIIQKSHHCKWVQVVHIAPEELAMYKGYSGAISRGGEKHQAEIQLCEKADFVVAVGPKLADDFSAYLRSCKKEVFDLTPGIFNEFAHLKQAPQEGKTFRLLVFGRGDTEDFELKGYDIAAQAVAELKDPTYRLIFVGAPNGNEDEVKENLLRHGISKNQLTVRSFRESRENLAKLFCEADLAIMPSRTEGFGLTALEALSAGLPILVTANSGFGEALKKVDYGSSWIMDSEETGDWAEAIRKVRQKDRKLRLRESRHLLESYSEEYDWKKQCEALVEKMLSISHGSSGREPGSTESAHRSLPRLHAQVSGGSGRFFREHKDSSEVKQSEAQQRKRPLVPSDTQGPRQSTVKIGTPSDEEMEELAAKIGNSWEKLGRRLKFDEADITGFDDDYKKTSTKAHKMFIAWKGRDGPDATYQTLYDALDHHLVARRDLGTKFCCV